MQHSSLQNISNRNTRTTTWRNGLGSSIVDSSQQSKPTTLYSAYYSVYWADARHWVPPSPRRPLPIQGLMPCGTIVWQTSGAEYRTIVFFKENTPWPESANELYRPSDRRLSAKLVPTFADRGVSRAQRDGSLRPYSLVSRPEQLLFLSSSSSIVLTRLSGPCSRPATSQKMW
jgi:hypothetical protein